MGCPVPVFVQLRLDFRFWRGFRDLLLPQKLLDIRKCQGHANLHTSQEHEEDTGQAKITPGFNLPSKYIIHTVGPIVQGRLTKENERLLASCYRSILELADQNDIKTLALCCISTGVFMFPNQRAAEIAVETVRKYLEETGSQIKVIFNVFKDIDLMFYKYYLGEPEAE